MPISSAETCFALPTQRPFWRILPVGHSGSTQRCEPAVFKHTWPRGHSYIPV